MSGPLHATISKEQSIVIRRATAVDAGVCGKICFEAFCTIAAQHGFPPDFPSPEIPIHILSTMFSHPGFFCVVAEQEGKVIGSNCLDERTPIGGVGPITINPAVQNRTVGRQLMRSCAGSGGRTKVCRSALGTGRLSQSFAFLVCEARFCCSRTAGVHARSRNSQDAAWLSNSSCPTRRRPVVQRTLHARAWA